MGRRQGKFDQHNRRDMLDMLDMLVPTLDMLVPTQDSPLTMELMPLPLQLTLTLPLMPLPPLSTTSSTPTIMLVKFTLPPSPTFTKMSPLRHTPTQISKLSPMYMRISLP